MEADIKYIKSKLKDLNEEEITKVIQSLDEFENSFYTYIGDSENISVITTENEFGRPLKEEQLEDITEEVISRGFVPLYEINTKSSLVIIDIKDLSRIGIIPKTEFSC